MTNFHVPGLEREMRLLQEMFELHHPGARPLATMWDEWLVAPGLAWATDDSDERRRSWDEALSTRIIDAEGHVASHQHPSIGHPLGWPFPFWTQAEGGFGWHFSDALTMGDPFTPPLARTPDGWVLDGVCDLGISESGWALRVERDGASITAPEWVFDAEQAPFVQIRWEGSLSGDGALEWGAPHFNADCRFHFEFSQDHAVRSPPVHLHLVGLAPTIADNSSRGIVCTPIPVHRAPMWQEKISRLRIRLPDGSAGTTFTLHGLFAQYDTRHNINNAAFVLGCTSFFRWTGDLSFLRRNIDRIRTALRYMMTELGGRAHRCVVTPWPGHDGRSGLQIDDRGARNPVYGRGIGNSYLDILPFGGRDCYATIRYYAALESVAALEEHIAARPESNVARGAARLDPEELRRHAAEVRSHGNALFWNDDTGRFVACVDVDGRQHDYGYTFLNLDAVVYGFATPEHAESVIDWLTGQRVVEGDTSQGADIYHWRLGPRTSTRRNLEWYGWYWSRPETIPWGDQVQDGGAVLGFSAFDIAGRLRQCGPDAAWKRLHEVIEWFGDVQSAGGYRAYYSDGTRGKLQGGGPAGGLGMDMEFVESILVPQMILDAFLGFSPRGDGFSLAPQLPSDWPSLRVSQVLFRGLVLDIEASRERITVRRTGSEGTAGTMVVQLSGWSPRDPTGITWCENGLVVDWSVTERIDLDPAR